MKIGIIGTGAIGRYVIDRLEEAGHEISNVLVRPERLDIHRREFHGAVSDAGELPNDLDVVAECGGHGALRAHGPKLLERGMHVVSVSVGAMADTAFSGHVEEAARVGGGRLTFASGAIGALDALQAAQIGSLQQVMYSGRKPPQGWVGSRAESILDLANMGSDPITHFEGSARDAAQLYPKNANVAAAVALAGLGFDHTRVRLIADPNVTANIHEIGVEGSFGTFSFRIEGNALPGNPRSSALAAMSVVSKILACDAPISL